MFFWILKKRKKRMYI